MQISTTFFRTWNTPCCLCSCSKVDEGNCCSLPVAAVLVATAAKIYPSPSARKTGNKALYYLVTSHGARSMRQECKMKDCFTRSKLLEQIHRGKSEINLNKLNKAPLRNQHGNCARHFFASILHTHHFKYIILKYIRQKMGQKRFGLKANLKSDATMGASCLWTIEASPSSWTAFNESLTKNMARLEECEI